MKCFALATLVATALAAATTNPVARGYQCTPPSYVCKPDLSGWLVCNVDGTFLDAGVCPHKTHCESINNLPYCV